MRRDVYERHPWLATSLYKAFQTSKQVALKRLRYVGSLFTMLPWLNDELEEIDRLFDGDPFPYGVEQNRQTLEALVRHLADQHLIRAPIPVDDLFVPVRGIPGA